MNARSLATLCLAVASCTDLGGVSGKWQGDVLAQRTGYGLAGVNAGLSTLHRSNNVPVSGGLNRWMNDVQEHQRQLQAGVKNHLWFKAGDKTKDEWKKAGEQTKNDWVTSGQKTLDALDLAGREVLERRHTPKLKQEWLEDMLKKGRVPVADLNALFPPQES